MDFRLLRRILPIIAISYVAMLPMESTPFLILGAEHGAKLTAEQADWVGTACVFAVAIGSIAKASRDSTERRSRKLACRYKVVLD